MEKLSYPPLITHLKEQSAFYSEVYKSHELKKGAIEPAVFIEWMVEVAEPILKEVDQWNPAYLSPVCHSLFTTILNMQSQAFVLANAREVKAALLLSKLVPVCLGAEPSRVLNGLYSATRSIRAYQPDRILDWINKMKETIPDCQSVEELLNIGRVCAWLCGMTHLRDRATTIYDSFPEKRKKALSNNNAFSFEEALENPWHKNEIGFIGVMSGFTGLAGHFNKPPLVAKIGTQVFASDGINSTALFADRFGQVVLEQGTVVAATVMAHARNLKLPKAIVDLQDISSAVIDRDTLFLTRTSSHAVYLYSA